MFLIFRSENVCLLMLLLCTGMNVSVLLSILSAVSENKRVHYFVIINCSQFSVMHADFWRCILTYCNCTGWPKKVSNYHESLLNRNKTRYIG